LKSKAISFARYPPPKKKAILTGVTGRTGHVRVLFKLPKSDLYKCNINLEFVVNMLKPVSPGTEAEIAEQGIFALPRAGYASPIGDGCSVSP
jgi:hypothetical protein